MNSGNVVLPIPTNRTVSGPQFRKENVRIVIEYDFEGDDGRTRWAQIVFDETLAFQYRQIACCREVDIVGAREVRSLPQSDLLSATLEQWQESVGWQEWQRKQGGDQRFKHFTVFFDDVGCVDVIATSCCAYESSHLGATPAPK